jgi:hypothetical protein
MRRPLLPAPTVSERGATIGRPRKAPPPDAAQRIQQLAAEGRPAAGIAVKLGTTAEVLRRWFTEDSKLREAFEAGREAERHELHQILMRDARDGERVNVNAIFLLKARHGYREGDPGEQASRVNVVINLPGALAPADYLKTVNAARPDE